MQFRARTTAGIIGRSSRQGGGSASGGAASGQRGDGQRRSSPAEASAPPISGPITDISQITVARPDLELSVDDSVHAAVLYADLFDYPLTHEEIFTFALAPARSPVEIERAIDRLVACGDLETNGIFVYCRTRASLVARRLMRQRHARRAWRRARFYARILWALPYVRMVAVTGALAMDNVDPGDDIDYLIVTDPGRLWMARGLIIGVTKLVRCFGDTLCPNYVISSRALRLDRRDLYVAHELAQMVPLHGRGMAARLWAENAWCRDLLPNAHCRGLERASDELPMSVRLIKALAQKLLWLPPAEKLEQWEQRRKVAKLSQRVPAYVAEALYTADVCKGHDHGHGERIMRLWLSRCTRQRETPTDASDPEASTYPDAVSESKGALDGCGGHVGAEDCAASPITTHHLGPDGEPGLDRAVQ